MQEIQNERLYQAFITGAKEVMNNRLLLNQINVFPVPDADTGNNLYSMMNSIIIYSEVKESLRATLASISESAIIGARGNSGVIFAQYIQGLCAFEAQSVALDREQFILAAENGVSYAYSAVESPVEGTMLTAMRIFHKSLLKYNDIKISFMDVLEHAYLQVEASVNQTTNQLAVLKKASVVDSGAKGFAFFIKGFISGLKGKSISLEHHELVVNFEMNLGHKYADVLTPPKYRYCTEALISGHEKKFKHLKRNLAAYGDSVVVSSGSSYSRIHLHTNCPSEVFKSLSENFEIKEQKVDDMLRQYMQQYQRKYKTVVVTDSIADLPQFKIDDGQVVVIPLEILIGDQYFMDGLTINNDMIFEMGNKLGNHHTSSLPNIHKVKKMLVDLMHIYEDAVIITVSKKMSGTYHIIKMAAEIFGDRIQVIDSKQNSVAQGLIVYNAIKMLEDGYNALEIREHVEALVPKSRIFVSVKNLDNMVASGRLNSHLAGVVKQLKLYPIISIDTQGRGVIAKMIWGIKNRKRALLKLMLEAMRSYELDSFAVTYVDDKEEAEYFVKEAEKFLGIKCEYLVQCSSIIAAGAGKGAFAVAYTRK
ncbi:DegV family protein [Fusibacter ferrireducens]|uniref:DegV family EDD domain-containing protein n=1 Tax=Fusibacter ferrireducens TaxID=2785058 RepID=A0ABR9ZWI8_9FIRM|nr:DegV family protein [Fusibacter ferrireducens]MBF4694837.1 DegV family EDD domain-containing protein [Fusibacter ferrireducens]